MAVKDGLPATDFSRMNREYIKNLIEESGGSGGLPDITEADEGKFLGVVSGDAAWATPGGGGGGSVLMITLNGTTLNKTGQQIADAFTSGTMCIVLKQTDEENGYTITEHDIIIEYASSGSEVDGYSYLFVSAGPGDIGLVSTIYTCTDLADYPSIPH